MFNFFQPENSEDTHSPSFWGRIFCRTYGGHLVCGALMVLVEKKMQNYKIINLSQNLFEFLRIF